LKAFLISDNHDTLVLLRLAGVKGVIAHDGEGIKRAIAEALEDEGTGILVLTEKISSRVPEMVKDIRERQDLPLVIEIPDRHGSIRNRNFLTEYLKEAIGVNIE